MPDMKNLIWGTLAATLLTLLSIRYWDRPVAEYILEHLGRRFLFGARASSMPDLLVGTAATVSAICWSGYFLLSRKKISDNRTLFFKILGTSLPIAFVLKDILKWIFGRVDARFWLAQHQDLSFHWFQGERHFNGFPSGHMLVFTTIFFALWGFMPRARSLFLLGWLSLAAALLLTEYHFLADVIAGSFLGYLVHAGTSRLYSKTNLT